MGERASQDIILIQVSKEPNQITELENIVRETFMTAYEIKARASRVALASALHKAMITFHRDCTRSCQIIDISATGMQVRTEHEASLTLQVEQRLKIKWGDGFRQYPVSAEVRWFKVQDNGEVNIGMQFLGRSN